MKIFNSKLWSTPGNNSSRGDYAVSTTAVVRNPKGIHARPAGKIAGIAAYAKGEIVLIKQGEIASARDVMDILALFCPSDTPITIAAVNELDQQIVNDIAELINQHYEE